MKEWLLEDTKACTIEIVEERVQRRSTMRQVELALETVVVQMLAEHEALEELQGKDRTLDEEARAV